MDDRPSRRMTAAARPGGGIAAPAAEQGGRSRVVPLVGECVKLMKKLEDHASGERKMSALAFTKKITKHTEESDSDRKRT